MRQCGKTTVDADMVAVQGQRANMKGVSPCNSYADEYFGMQGVIISSSD